MAVSPFYSYTSLLYTKNSVQAEFDSSPSVELRWTRWNAVYLLLFCRSVSCNVLFSLFHKCRDYWLSIQQQKSKQVSNSPSTLFFTCVFSFTSYNFFDILIISMGKFALLNFFIHFTKIQSSNYAIICFNLLWMVEFQILLWMMRWKTWISHYTIYQLSVGWSFIIVQSC